MSNQATLSQLLAAMPALEQQAQDLQHDRDHEPTPTAIQALRDAYLAWYAQCLPLIPEPILLRFRDMYEGGTFTRRIRQFLEAPRERSAFAQPSAGTAENPLTPYWTAPFEITFRPSFFGQQGMLREAVEKERTDTAPKAARSVEAMVRRFPLIIMEINRRRENRTGWPVNDEYDVQDLVRALLVGWFDDVRPEEWTPSYAGGSSRMDFLLKAERIVVETKMVGGAGSAKEVRDELAQDILRYQAHSDCEIMVCFVFDPGMRITNPRGFEQDLSVPQGNLGVLVAVVQ